MKKFYRGNGYIGGVCEGLGNYFDIDPIFIRLLFLWGWWFYAGLTFCIYLGIWAFIDYYDYD
jgi:phage shock protein PspC (stress-responsive transcriptional regulator)